MREAHKAWSVSARLPLARAEVRACADEIVALALRLRADEPIDVRGAAMVAASGPQRQQRPLRRGAGHAALCGPLGAPRARSAGPDPDGPLRSQLAAREFARGREAPRAGRVFPDMLIEPRSHHPALSHAAGPRDVPLLEQTIGEAPAPHRRALRRPRGARGARAGLPRDLPRAVGRGRARRPRPARPRRAHGRPRRHLGAQPLRVARHPVRHRAHRRDPRHHQPGLQGGRAASTR